MRCGSTPLTSRLYSHAFCGRQIQHMVKEWWRSSVETTEGVQAQGVELHDIRWEVMRAGCIHSSSCHGSCVVSHSVHHGVVLVQRIFTANSNYCSGMEHYLMIIMNRSISDKKWINGSTVMKTFPLFGSGWIRARSSWLSCSLLVTASVQLLVSNVGFESTLSLFVSLLLL